MAKNKTLDALERLADRQEPKVARALLDGFDELRRRFSDRQIARMIDRGDVEDLLDAINQQNVVEAMQPFAAAIAATGMLGAKATAETQKPVKGPGNTIVNFTFNVANPRLSEAAQTQTATRIREVGNDVRAVVRQVIDDGTNAGDGALTIARRLRDSIGLTTRQEMSVRNYRADLERGTSAALDRALRDKRFDPSVRRAIEGEKPLTQAQINRMVDRYRARFIKYRSQVIARTETIRALQAAQHALLQSYVDEGRLDYRQIRREWIYTRDDRTRNAHREIPALNPKGVGLNEPFQTPLGPLIYPADPNGLPANSIQCRCVVFPRILSMELVNDGF